MRGVVCGIVSNKCIKTGAEGQWEEWIKLHGPFSKAKTVGGQFYSADLVTASVAVVRRRKGRVLGRECFCLGDMGIIMTATLIRQILTRSQVVQQLCFQAE